MPISCIVESAERNHVVQVTQQGILANGFQVEYEALSNRQLIDWTSQEIGVRLKKTNPAVSQ
jgi:hypothetical protein